MWMRRAGVATVAKGLWKRRHGLNDSSSASLARVIGAGRLCLASEAAALNTTVYHDEHPMKQTWHRRDAFRLLQKAQKPDIILERCETARELVGQDPLQPAEVTILVSKYGQAGDTELAQGVLELPRGDTQLHDELRITCALMSALQRNGKWGESRDIFLQLDNTMLEAFDDRAIRVASKLAVELVDEEVLRRLVKIVSSQPELAEPVEFHLALLLVEARNNGPEAAQGVLDELEQERQQIGLKMLPKEAAPFYEALCESYAAAGNHTAVLNTGIRMLDATQRPTERVVTLAIEAVEALGDVDETNDQMFTIFSRFRAGPRIDSSVYEHVMRMLAGHKNPEGVVAVYDEAGSKRRPTEAMNQMFMDAISKFEYTEQVDLCHQYSLPLPKPKVADPFEFYRADAKANSMSEEDLGLSSEEIEQQIGIEEKFGKVENANEELLEVFSRYRTATRIESSTYEHVMRMLAAQKNAKGVVAVYDKVVSMRRPTKVMNTLVTDSISKFAHSEQVELFNQFNLPLPKSVEQNDAP